MKVLKSEKVSRPITLTYADRVHISSASPVSAPATAHPAAPVCSVHVKLLLLVPLVWVRYCIFRELVMC